MTHVLYLGPVIEEQRQVRCLCGWHWSCDDEWAVETAAAVHDDAMLIADGIANADGVTVCGFDGGPLDGGSLPVINDRQLVRFVYSTPPRDTWMLYARDTVTSRHFTYAGTEPA